MKPVLTKTSMVGYGSGSFWNALLGIVAFLVVIALSFIVLKWLSKRMVGGSSSHMRVIERMGVGQGTYLMLVQVGQRVLALSATKDGLKFLCELPLGDIEQDEAGVAPPSQGTDAKTNDPSVWKRFVHNMRIQAGLLPKDTPPARPASALPSTENAPTPQEDAAVLGAFALALQRAQAESTAISDKTDGLDFISILNQERANPIPKPAEAEDSGRSALADYNTAIESMKQLGRMEKPAPPRVERVERAVTPRVTREENNAAPRAEREEHAPMSRVAREAINTPPRDEQLEYNTPPRVEIEERTPMPRAAREELEERALGSIPDEFDTPEPERDIIREERIAPVAPRAAAATYKAASAPIRQQPRLSAEELWEAEDVDGEAAEILQVLNERRQQRTAEAVTEQETPAVQPAPVPPPTAKLKAEREAAAQKLREDDRVDELFDKITQRSSRYGRTKKE